MDTRNTSHLIVFNGRAAVVSTCTYVTDPILSVFVNAAELDVDIARDWHGTALGWDGTCYVLPTTFSNKIRFGTVKREDSRLVGLDPVAMYEATIPCPKVRKGTQTRWTMDGWEKLTAKGWQIVE